MSDRRVHAGWVTNISRMCLKAPCKITRPITNTGDVCSPACLLYSSQYLPKTKEQKHEKSPPRHQCLAGRVRGQAKWSTRLGLSHYNPCPAGVDHRLSA